MSSYLTVYFVFVCQKVLFHHSLCQWTNSGQPETAAPFTQLRTSDSKPLSRVLHVTHHNQPPLSRNVVPRILQECAVWHWKALKVKTLGETVVSVTVFFNPTPNTCLSLVMCIHAATLHSKHEINRNMQRCGSKKGQPGERKISGNERRETLEESVAACQITDIFTSKEQCGRWYETYRWCFPFITARFILCYGGKLPDNLKYYDLHTLTCQMEKYSELLVSCMIKEKYINVMWKQTYI